MTHEETLRTAAEVQLAHEVSRLTARSTKASARYAAERLLGARLPGWAVEHAAQAMLLRGTAAALRDGWGPGDLANATARLVDSDLDGVVADLAARARAQVGSAWSPVWDGELVALGRPTSLTLVHADGLTKALRLVVAMTMLAMSTRSRAGAPTGAATSPAAPAAGSRESAKLAQVRALLAKAESTSSPHEAEAFSAKAQELISRYSLALIVAADTTSHESGLTYRRLWQDAPYVDAKSHLVQAVAAANRCRAVFNPHLSLCTVIGTPFDLDAVELMVTSLLVQAQQAMLAEGSRVDRWGTSRTRSFRRSFLLSFAVHIGHRLAEAAEESETKAEASLLPALRHHDAAVQELTATMFPKLVSSSPSISNPDGWFEGREAAERADLGNRQRLVR